MRHWTAPLGCDGAPNIRWDVDSKGKITRLYQPVNAATAIVHIEYMYDALYYSIATGV